MNNVLPSQVAVTQRRQPAPSPPAPVPISVNGPTNAVSRALGYTLYSVHTVMYSILKYIIYCIFNTPSTLFHILGSDSWPDRLLYFAAGRTRVVLRAMRG